MKRTTKKRRTKIPSHSTTTTKKKKIFPLLLVAPRIPLVVLRRALAHRERRPFMLRTQRRERLLLVDGTKMRKTMRTITPLLDRRDRDALAAPVDDHLALAGVLLRDEDQWFPTPGSRDQALLSKGLKPCVALSRTPPRSEKPPLHRSSRREKLLRASLPTSTVTSKV
jgi:hypothetical protein